MIAVPISSVNCDIIGVMMFGRICTNYRAAQAVTIYTTSDSETLKSTVKQEKITYILFEDGSEFEQQVCQEKIIAATYEKVYETQDGRIRIYKTN